MSIDELIALHDEVTAILSAKIVEEKSVLERRLAALRGHPQPAQKQRRSYPPVRPKFADPDEPGRVWSGRGKQPRWIAAKLASGLSLNDLRIGKVGGTARSGQRVR